MADTTIKKWNGTAWEDVYPETTVGQIQASGTPSSSTYLRGDGTWATVTATGDIEGVTAGSGLTGGGTSGTVTLSHADTSTATNLTASGRTYVSGLTFDTYGHVTGYSTGTETVVDTNTTYTAGSGLTLTGTQFSHTDTSSQGSVNNSNGTVIQDVTLDTYGHVTGLASVDLDGRYYTESEADGRFVNVTGDTMTGELTIATTSGVSKLNINAVSGQNSQLFFQEAGTLKSAITYVAGSDSLAFYHEGADRITINSSGNVTMTGSLTTPSYLEATQGVAVWNGSLNIDTDYQDRLWATSIGTETTRGTKPGNYFHYVNLPSNGTTRGLQFGGYYGGNNDLYVRTRTDSSGGSWLSWAEVWTSQSDGSGSGLDADLLDGQHASAFAAASHTHDDRYYTESEADSRFINTTDSYVSSDLSGSASYPRLVVNNSGAADPSWIRVSSNSHGILPYSDGSSYIGTSSWKFGQIHAVNFYENQTALSSKYAPISHTHDYVPERNRTDWNDGTVIDDVIGQMAWKNYGNNHTIFDASAATSPAGGAIDRTNSQVAWSASYPTLMGWNGSNTYGVRVDSARVADSAGSAGNADTVDGFHASQTAGSANTAVVRNSSGYIMNTWFNSSRSNETSAAASYIYDTGDGYMRKKTLANAQAEIVTSAAVTSALGYTPYNSTNPSGYTTNTGTVTSVATGGGLTGGTITTSGTISHADTSSQASVNNSGNTMIQDITLDTYGHITGIVSASVGWTWEQIRGRSANGTLTSTGTSGSLGGSIAAGATLAQGDTIMMEVGDNTSVSAGYNPNIILFTLGAADTIPTGVEQGVSWRSSYANSTLHYDYSFKVGYSSSTLYFDDAFRWDMLDSSTASSIITTATYTLHVGRIWRLKA